MRKSTTLLLPAICLFAAFIIQAVFLARYVGRLPHDWVGIGLYSAALIGFALAAVGFLIQWRRQVHLEEHGPNEEEV